MDDRIRVIGGGLLGAVVGGLAAYLLFTDEGRDRLSRLAPAADDLSRVLQDMRTTLSKLGDVALEGRRTAGQVLAAFSEGSHHHTWH
jgi:hypothetical protein